MKTIKSKVSLVAICAVLGIFLVNNSYAQVQQNNNGDEKAKEIENLVKARDFVFVAQTASPMRGSLRQLTTSYELRVSKDTVVADLPYFGRAYTAPIDPANAGIKFVSSSFSYDEKARKKGGWDINIKPGAHTDARQLTLNITQNGYASLQVTSNNRQPISFNGYIKERKQR